MKPKSARSAYLYWLADNRSKIQDEHPEIPKNEIMTYVGKIWRQLTKEEKKSYVELADADKRRYNEEMKDYVPSKEDIDKEKSKKKRKIMINIDPNRPKKGLSAFMWFSNEKRPIYKANYPNLSFGELAKKIGEAWRNLSVEEKQPYNEKARIDKERYDEAMKNYVIPDGMYVEKKTKPEKKEKPPKDENAPKRPPSAYLLFCTKMREQEKGKLSLTEIGSKWKTVSDEEKLPYEQEAKKLKREYQEKMKLYTPSNEFLEEKKAYDEKHKKKKDKNAPKRPRNAYLYFQKERRQQLVEERPELSNSELVQLISKEWKEFDKKSKEPYLILARSDKARYNEEMKSYVPPQETADKSSSSSSSSSSESSGSESDDTTSEKEDDSDSDSSSSNGSASQSSSSDEMED